MYMQELRKKLLSIKAPKNDVYFRTLHPVSHGMIQAGPWGLYRSNSPLATKPDFSAFKDKQCTTFYNKSGDTLLVIPRKSSQHRYSNLYQFAKNAPLKTWSNFFKKVDAAISKYRKKTGLDPYVSTHGHGVSWLHVRISAKPKYYTKAKLLVKHYFPRSQINSEPRPIVVLGPTSVGKTTYLKNLQAKGNICLIDIDDEYHAMDNHYRDNIWYKKNSKWNFNKYKRDFMKFLHEVHIPKQIRKCFRENPKRAIYLPHIEVPSAWTRLFPIRVIILYRPINEAMKFSSLRPNTSKRTYEQVRKDYMRLFEYSPKPFKKIRGLRITRVSPFYIIKNKSDIESFEKHFRLDDTHNVQYIRPRKIPNVTKIDIRILSVSGKQ